MPAAHLCRDQPCAVRRGRRRELFKENKTMFAFNPGVNDTSGQILGQGMVSSAQTRADAGVKMVDDIGGALVSLAGAYGQARDKKAVLKGMDQTMGAMSDMEILPKGFLNHYNQLDEDTRPFIFQTLASPMFQAYQKKQGYMDYATAMRGVYGNRGGGMPAPGVLEQF
jgi:hypothetical protein